MLNRGLGILAEKNNSMAMHTAKPYAGLSPQSVYYVWQMALST